MASDFIEMYLFTSIKRFIGEKHFSLTKNNIEIGTISGWIKKCTNVQTRRSEHIFAYIQVFFNYPTNVSRENSKNIIKFYDFCNVNSLNFSKLF